MLGIPVVICDIYIYIDPCMQLATDVLRFSVLN